MVGGLAISERGVSADARPYLKIIIIHAGPRYPALAPEKTPRAVGDGDRGTIHCPIACDEAVVLPLHVE